MTFRIEAISAPEPITPKHICGTQDTHEQQTNAANSQEQLEPLVEIWNQTFGAQYAISAQHLAYRLQTLSTQTARGTGAHEAAVGKVANSTTGLAESLATGLAVASMDEERVGFVLVSALPGGTQTYIDGLAVHPKRQGQGIGRALIEWASSWGAAHRSRDLLLGSGPLRLMPGTPVDSDTPAALWTRLGFDEIEPVHQDLAADISGYIPPEIVVDVPAQARPLAQREQSYLHTFMDHTTSRESQASIEHFLAHGGRMSDLMALWTADGIAAVVQITVEDSAGGIEPWFPYTLPKPWAALQFIAPAALQPPLRWNLLDAALRRLHNTGVNSCILAPTLDEHTAITHTADHRPPGPDSYAAFGFQPYHNFRRYRLQYTAPYTDKR